MRKNKIVETKDGRFVVIPLTKKYLIEGKIVPKGAFLLVEEEGVVDTIQTDADIASASSGDFDELYDQKSTLRRMRYTMDADDFPPETEVIPVDTLVDVIDDVTDVDVGIGYEDVMTPEEKFEMKRRIARMEKEEEDKAEMRRRIVRMRKGMDKEDEEDKDKMDKEDEEDKDKMRKRIRALMRRRMDKEDEEKDKMDKEDEDKDKMDKEDENEE